MTETGADTILLEKIRKGDPDAFDRFVDRYGDRIYGFGMHVCGEREDARDVAQDTLLQAFKSLKELKDPGALRTWLYRVASNACLMKRRKSKFAPAKELSLEELMPAGPDEASIEIPDASAMPDQAAERAETQRVVREAIRELPPNYRIVLILRDIEQLSTRETAEALGIAETAVKMRLHRARVMVRNRLAAGGDAEGTS
jgi:RNA polymerase sigma-70 factor (ECF subfamily)